MDLRTPDIDAFIAYWRASSANGRADFPRFAQELCDLLGVERPQRRPGRGRAATGPELP